jgi:hypothetical protein
MLTRKDTPMTDPQTPKGQDRAALREGDTAQKGGE